MTRESESMIPAESARVRTTHAAIDETVTLSLVVADVHGALDRVFGLARRQGCIVRALVLVPSDQPETSSLTLTVSGGAPKRLVQQLSRLVSVVSASITG